MTPDEIKAGNILIAEFDGYVPTGKIHPFDESKGPTYKKEGVMGVTWADKMYYHNDWNWIMPVVQKIEDTTKAHVCIYAGGCWIEFYGVNNDPSQFKWSSGSLIENIYGCITEYIKWLKTVNE